MRTVDIHPDTARAREYFERLDRIGTKAAQLESLLIACYGGGFESFSNLGEAHQENLIWLAADLADLAGEVLRETRREGTQGAAAA